jgi:hypothetical protein
MENAILTRFMKKVKEDPVTFCWLWMGSLTRGYGRFRVNGERVYAHRWSYEWFREPLPPWKGDGPTLQLDHLCHNRACVNPAHLEIVTSAENIQRGASAKLTKDQVLEIRARSAFGDTQKELGLRFGVSQPQISKIILRKQWTEI